MDLTDIADRNRSGEFSLVLKIKLTHCPSKIILVSGGSASGKTTVSKRICAIFNDHGITARCVSMDNFYRSLSDDECGEDYDWDDIEAFNCNRLIDCIDSWRRGVGCWIPQHNFSEYKSIERAEFIVPSQVIIVEGIHTLSMPELIPRSDLRLFITCDDDEALARRIKRDIKERGFSIDTILNRYFTFVKPALREVIQPSQVNADYIISNKNGGEIARDNAIELIIKNMVSQINDE